jgi:hypothetical protein
MLRSLRAEAVTDFRAHVDGVMEMVLALGWMAFRRQL